MCSVEQRSRSRLGQLAVLSHVHAVAWASSVRAACWASHRAGLLASAWAAGLACGRARAPATTGLSALRWAIRRSRLGRLCAGRSRVRPALLGRAASRVGHAVELSFSNSSRV